MGRIGCIFTVVGLVTGVLLSSSAHATNESQAAVLLLLIEPGARVGAMGESFVTISEDALATYYNPAGLAGQINRQLSFMHTNWLTGLGLEDLYYEFLAYSQYVKGWGNMGVSLAYFNLGKQIRMDEFGTELGTFHSYDFVLSAGYGANVSERTSVGLSMKFIYSHLAERGAGEEKGEGVGSTFAVDLGVLYHTSIQGLSVGAALRNLGPKISYIDARQADPLPLHFVLGSSYKILDTEYNDVLAVLDVYKPLIRGSGTSLESVVLAWTDEDMKEEFGQADLHLGVEYTYSSFLALRAGYSYDKDGELKTPTFGFGLRYNWVQIDYAHLPATDTPLQNNSRFSVTLNF